MGRKHWLVYFFGASVIALASQSASAQSQPDTIDSQKNDPQKSVTAARSNAATDNAATDDIVVTARFRDETLQDVPMSISVLSGQSISAQGIKNTTDLYGRVPGLYFTNGGGTAPTSDFLYLTIRGVGANGSLEPAAGVFIDGMYQPQLGFDVGFLDLERLEVLRGPQGTLFGRNTEAGALNLVTRKPGDTLEGRVEIEGAEFGTLRGFASVRGPIADGISAGLTGEYRRSDGFTVNPFDNSNGSPEEQFSIRGIVRIHPDDKLDISLSGDISRRHFNETGKGAPLSCHCYSVYQDRVNGNDPRDTKHNEGVQLNARYEFSSRVNLTSITGYRDVSSDIGYDYDAVPTDQTAIVANGVPTSSVAPTPVTIRGTYQHIRLGQRFFSQELRLAGSSAAFDWLAGGYYFNQDQRQRRDYAIGNVAILPAVSYLAGTAIREDYTMNRNGGAAFGQAIVRPVPRLEVTVGLRYAKEQVSIAGQRYRNITKIENANPTLFNLTGQKSFGNFTWLGSVSYKFDGGINLYGTVSRGWKAGGFNRFPSTALAVLPYASETSTNYEVGVKGSFFDHKVTANLSAFIVDLGAMQVNQLISSNGVPVTTIGNAAKSRSKGFEAELSARLTERFNVSTAVGYTDARYVNYLQCASATACVSRDGQRFSYVPKWTASASADYRLPLSAGDAIIFAANYRFVSETLSDDFSFVAPLGNTIPIPSYQRVDLRIGFEHQRWKLTGYVNNVFNSYDWTQASYNPFLAEVPQNLYVVPLAPRTFGAKVSYAF